jgi:hypothetical protein
MIDWNLAVMISMEMRNKNEICFIWIDLIAIHSYQNAPQRSETEIVDI